MKTNPGSRLLTFMAAAAMLWSSHLSATADDAPRERTLAFPGAEGYARYITGGRGGKVWHVTNLDDSGEGSLRWALGQAGVKTVVFDVSGTIHLKSGLSIPSNTTVAGQTAPGDGICVADYPMSISGNNVIVRFMRFRLGNENVLKDGADGWDGFGVMDHQDIMIDHCSVSWSIDECLSVLGNVNSTVQWCIVSQSLVAAGHTKGNHGYGGNWGGDHASFHHNLIIHHTSRTPRLGPRPTTQLSEHMDMRNNVIYNWGGNGCYGGEAMHVNIVNNYYKPGPGTPSDNKGKRIAGLGIRTNEYIRTYPAYAPALHMWGKFYVDGNVNSKYSDVTNDNWTYGIYNQINAADNDGLYNQTVKDTIRLYEPLAFTATTTHSAAMAYERVLDYAGASKSRDSHDSLMVSDARLGKASYSGAGQSGKGFINSQEDNRPAGAGSDWSAWPTLETRGSYVDSDGDGIPDTWEDFNGLDPFDPNDANQLNAEGYTMLEVYLNSLVANITAAQNEGGTLEGDIRVEGDEPAVSEYILSGQTSNGDWTFSNGLSITGSGTPATGSDGTIKYSRNNTYTIHLPEGVSIGAAKFYGYCNTDGNVSSYLSELGGNTYSETQYVFPGRQAAVNRATYTIDLPTPITGDLTFTPRGDAQSCFLITLYTASSSGIQTFRPDAAESQRVYTLDGRTLGSVEAERLPRGLYVIGGRKVMVR